MNFKLNNKIIKEGLFNTKILVFFRFTLQSSCFKLNEKLQFDFLPKNEIIFDYQTCQNTCIVFNHINLDFSFKHKSYINNRNVIDNVGGETISSEQNNTMNVEYVYVL